MNNNNPLQIVWYDSKKHTAGPFSAVCFVCINQSIPATGSVTVTYNCFHGGDDSELVTVPAASHSIEPARNDNRSDRLETLGLFIDTFEDFLEEKGIDIQNDEKDDDDNAAIIYGTDYGILSDRIENLLTDLGYMSREE